MLLLHMFLKHDHFMNTIEKPRETERCTCYLHISTRLYVSIYTYCFGNDCSHDFRSHFDISENIAR